jgi:hypothetical protein
VPCAPRILAAATVSLETCVVSFAGLVAKDLSSLSTGASLGLVSALAVAVFAVLWLVALGQGARIEREREAYSREPGG